MRGDALVLMGKVDCTGGGAELCKQQHVHAFPTVRVYRRHRDVSHESYIGDRTHEAIEKFVASNVHDDDASEAELEGSSEVAHAGEGCVVRGVVLVNRVPGNFHISAHSKSHSFQPGKLNMTHTVGLMTFGRSVTPSVQRMIARTGEDVSAYNTLAGSRHVAVGHNTTLEHYLKVAHLPRSPEISRDLPRDVGAGIAHERHLEVTHARRPFPHGHCFGHSRVCDDVGHWCEQVVHTTFTLSKRSKKVDTYQYTANTNTYEDGGSLPAAVFSYDVSPMQVTRGRCSSPCVTRGRCSSPCVTRGRQVIVEQQRKSFAAFLTQVCAIIGGVFTVTGLLDGVLYHSSAAVRRKMQIGKII